jgi:hypothetical protein
MSKLKSILNIWRLVVNLAAAVIVLCYRFFDPKYFKKVMFERRKKIAAAFMPEYVKALTACGDIREAYDALKGKIEVPEWERFKSFLDSEEYLKDSPELQAAVANFSKYLEPIKGRLNPEQLNTFFRKNPFKDPFARAFIVIWLYNFYAHKMPEFKKVKK